MHRRASAFAENRVVTNLYDDALRPLGLKISQVNILVVAAKLGVARPIQVCELLQLDVSTLSRNLFERSGAQGWLGSGAERRRPHSIVPFDDAKGKRLLEKVVPAWEKAQQAAKECWPAEGSPP